MAPKQGASKSTKELVDSLAYGRRVQFITPVGPIEGYLAGMDDYHWMVIDPDTIEHLLIHKGSAPVIRLAATVTLPDEPRCDEITAAIAPYRQWLMEDHQVRQPKQKREPQPCLSPPTLTPLA